MIRSARQLPALIATAAMVWLAAGCGDSGNSGSEPRVPEIDLSDPVKALIDADVAARADDRDYAGLASLGPDALALAAAMDASAAQLLDEYAAELAPASGLLRPAGVPGPGSNAWSVYGFLASSLHQLATNPQTASVESPAETTRINGNTATVSTTANIRATVTGSQLSVEITVNLRGQLTDGNGAVLYSINSTASGHVEMNFCPDASGHTTAQVSLTSNESYTGGAGGRATTREQSADVGITVGDDANITRIEGTVSGSDSRQGAPGASGTAAPVATRTSSDNIANDRNGRRLPGVNRDIQLGGENSTTDQQTRFFGDTNIFMELMVGQAAKEAEKLWQSGKCVELIIDPDGGKVEPGEIVQVTARLKHKIEGNELDKPIVASLNGVKTLEPAGEKQPAPATVTFTAGENEGDKGVINFKSVSNRGIAEKSATFTVGAKAWDVTFEGTDVENFGGVLVNTFAARADLRITAQDGVLTGTGELHLTGEVKLPPCAGPLDQISQVTVSGTLEGEGPEAVLRITLRATSPAGAIIVITCPGITQNLGAEGHAERFGEPLLNFELPAAGGSVDVSETTAVGGVMQVTVTGVFIVTPSQ